MMRYNIVLLFVLSIFWSGCYNNNEKPTEKIPDTYNTKARAAWQKPEVVIEKLGNLEDKVVADIGSGTGYFSFRFAMKSKHVIAVDIDKDMLELMDLFSLNLPKDIHSKLETRLGKPDNPNLTANEVDLAVVINTFSYIKDRRQYLETLKAGLRNEKKVMILNFKYANISPESPPQEDRIKMEDMKQDLLISGYNILDIDTQSLEHQYIIIAEATE